MSKIKLLCTVFLLSTTVGIIAMKQPTEKVTYQRLSAKSTLKITELHAPPKSLTLQVNEFNKNVVKFEKIKKEVIELRTKPDTIVVADSIIIKRKFIPKLIDKLK